MLDCTKLCVGTSIICMDDKLQRSWKVSLHILASKLFEKVTECVLGVALEALLLCTLCIFRETVLGKVLSSGTVLSLWISLYLCQSSQRWGGFYLAYSATTPTKATQAISLQIDLWHLRVETINLKTPVKLVVILWCAAYVDRCFVKNVLFTSKISIHQFAKNLLWWPWLE